jgi:hypothetical protein
MMAELRRQISELRTSSAASPPSQVPKEWQNENYELLVLNNEILKKQVNDIGKR